jgi:CheY-like chemotaxis protein
MKSLRVLLVEDDEPNRHLATTRLSLLGYEVVPCVDGFEAIARAIDEAQRFDLALMDLRMPGMNGCEVIRRLRAHPGTRSMPILVVSAEPAPGMAAGADHFIAKPYHLHELVLAIGETLGRRCAPVEAP